VAVVRNSRPGTAEPFRADIRHVITPGYYYVNKVRRSTVASDRPADEYDRSHTQSQSAVYQDTISQRRGRAVDHDCRRTQNTPTSDFAAAILLLYGLAFVCGLKTTDNVVINVVLVVSFTFRYSSVVGYVRRDLVIRPVQLLLVIIQLRLVQ